MLESLVSIIVPVYNVEKYLSSCIESILNQSYTKFEVIMIENMSTDRSFEIAEQFKLKDNRIKLIRHNIKGVSEARNVGLNEARGEFIIFVDSDDVLHPDFIMTMLRAAIEYKADLALCDFESVLHIPTIIPAAEKTSFELVNRADLWNRFAADDVVKYTTVWGKIFRADLLKNVRFNTDLLYSEDNELMCRVYMKCKTIIETSAKLYIYVRRPDAAMKTYNFSRIGLAEVWLKDYEFLMSIPGEKRGADLCILRAFKCILGLRYDFIINNCYDENKKTSLEGLYKKYIKSFFCSEITIMQKIIIFMMWKFKFLYSLFMKYRR